MVQSFPGKCCTLYKDDQTAVPDMLYSTLTKIVNILTHWSVAPAGSNYEKN